MEAMRKSINNLMEALQELNQGPNASTELGTPTNKKKFFVGVMTSPLDHGKRRKIARNKRKDTKLMSHTTIGRVEAMQNLQQDRDDIQGQ
eukprot:13269539-Ditylum_brightwellii.AAC.1